MGRTLGAVAIAAVAAVVAVYVGLSGDMLGLIAAILGGALVLLLATLKFGPVNTVMNVFFFLLPMNGIRAGGAAIADFALVAALLVALVSTPRAKVSMPTWVSVPLFLIVLAALVASAVSPFPVEGIATTIRLAVAAVACVFLIFRLAPTPAQIQYWFTAFAIGQAISVIDAHQNRPRYSDRLDGLTTHANTFGLLSAITFIILITRFRRGRNVLAQLLDVALLVAALLGIFASGSRAALIASVAGTLVFVLTSRHVTRALIVGAIIIPPAVIPFVTWQMSLPGSALQRLFAPTEFETDSNTGRISQAAYSIQRWEQQPLLGGGMDIAAEAHNVYLQLLTASGPLALVSFLAITLGVVFRLISRKGYRADVVPMRRTMLAIMVCYLVAAAVSNNLWDRFVWIFIGLGAYIAVSSRSVPDSPPALIPAAIPAARTANSERK